ncbi:MAG: starch-binding protein [Bacteroidales bacterium]|nr:starch-binding protein [Candidatus Colicola faecequi]
MKKIFLAILMLLPMLFVGCKQEELVFEYENIHFETKANAILLELVVPSSTAPTDQIYVIGEFNDNKISPEFLMTKHEDTNIKFGIYLYPEDFVNGKTLADGFTFFNMKQGNELLKNNELHVLENAQVGERYVISFGRWAGLGGGDEPVVPGEYEHCYLIGNIAGSGWKPAEPVELEMVGTDIFRGEVTFESDATAYFAVLTAKGADNDDWATVNAARWGAGNALLSEGEVLDLQLQDGSDQCVTITPGTYTTSVNLATKQIAIGEDVEWTTDGGDDKFPVIDHAGQDIIFAADAAGWEAITLYMWGDVNNLDRDGGESAGWPGLEADGEFDFGGLHWYYFLMGTANVGKSENVILNNNGGGAQTGDLGTVLADGNEYYYIVNADKSVTVVEDPNTFDFSPYGEPAPEPEAAIIDVYLFLAEGISQTHVYVWGAEEVMGGWPGKALTELDETQFLGLNLRHIHHECKVGDDFHYIINGGDAGQYDAFVLNATADPQTHYFKITETKAESLTVAALAPKR